MNTLILLTVLTAALPREAKPHPRFEHFVEHVATGKAALTRRRPASTSEHRTFTTPESLARLAKMPKHELRAAVKSMSREQVRALRVELARTDVPDAEGRAELFHRIGREALASAYEALLGKLYWAGPSGADPADRFKIDTRTERKIGRQNVNGKDESADAVEQNRNHFALWLRGKDDQLPADPTTWKMNCWESVMFASYRAGLVDKIDLQRIHVKASLQARAAAKKNPALGDVLGEIADEKVLVANLEQDAEPLADTRGLARGDVVFFGDLGHVAVVLDGPIPSGPNAGEHPMGSLYSKPVIDGHYATSMQRTTVEAFHRLYKKDMKVVDMMF